MLGACTCGSAERKRPIVRIVDAPVHVHETDRIDHLMVGEAACRERGVERHDGGVGQRLPVDLAAPAPGIEAQALNNRTGGVGNDSLWGGNFLACTGDNVPNIC